MNQKVRKEFVKLISDVGELLDGNVKEIIQTDIAHVFDALIEQGEQENQAKHEKAVLSGEVIQ